jgi:hypothetical protein
MDQLHDRFQINFFNQEATSRLAVYRGLIGSPEYEAWHARQK